MKLVRPVVDLKARYAGVYPRVELELRDGRIAVGRAVVHVEVRIVEIHRALLGPSGNVHVATIRIDPDCGRLYVPYGKRPRDVVDAFVAGGSRRAFRRIFCRLCERFVGKVSRHRQCDGGQGHHGRDCHCTEMDGHRPARRCHCLPPPSLTRRRATDVHLPVLTDH